MYLVRKDTGYECCCSKLQYSMLNEDKAIICTQKNDTTSQNEWF